MAELRKRIAACDVEWIQGVVAAARMDLEHANSIIDGSWPDADEIIAERRAKRGSADAPESQTAKSWPRSEEFGLPVASETAKREIAR